MRESLVNRRVPRGMFVLALAICLALTYLGIAIATGEFQNHATSQNPEITTGEKAWGELIKGNQRFVAGERAERNLTARRTELIAAQHPFATVITCSDSRVSPEILFDQGLGDIFVIRTAGNVVEPVVLGSIEYGVEHLDTPILVVLGHQSCGAVTAAVEDHAVGNIGSILEEIEPAVEKAKETGKTETELVEEAVNENVKLVITNILSRSTVTRERVKEGELEIVGAKYFLDTGEVEVIERVNATSPLLAELPTPTPSPTPTVSPTAAPSPSPTPPGFEAVFAIAGLLAVAYLVLRKRK